MAETFTKTSITNGEATPVATKFAVSYIRVSTKAQTGEDKSGVERQVQDYIDWLRDHPLYKNLDGIEFRDLGISGRGKNLKQGALGLILKMAESGELPAHTCLVVESMSRLTRDQPYDGIVVKINSRKLQLIREKSNEVYPYWLMAIKY